MFDIGNNSRENSVISNELCLFKTTFLSKKNVIDSCKFHQKNSAFKLCVFERS